MPSVRFLSALLGGEHTSPAALAAMRETVDAAPGGLFRYGLGLQLGLVSATFCPAG